MNDRGERDRQVERQTDPSSQTQNPSPRYQVQTPVRPKTHTFHPNSGNSTTHRLSPVDPKSTHQIARKPAPMLDLRDPKKLERTKGSKETPKDVHSELEAGHWQHPDELSTAARNPTASHLCPRHDQTRNPRFTAVHEHCSRQKRFPNPTERRFRSFIPSHGRSSRCFSAKRRTLY